MYGTPELGTLVNRSKPKGCTPEREATSVHSPAVQSLVPRNIGMMDTYIFGIYSTAGLLLL